MEQNKNKDFNKELKKKFAINPEVEKFYTKPETDEDLKKGMEIIKNIPENLNTPKVLLKLGNPNVSDKFVHMKDKNGRDYVIALPIDKKALHRDIVDFSKELYKKELSVLGGGYTHIEGDTLIIDGVSGDFGEANKARVGEILREAFPDLKIEIKEEGKNKVLFFEEKPLILPGEHEKIYESMVQKSKGGDDIEYVKDMKKGKNLREKIFSIFSRNTDEKLIVGLPGVTDVEKATADIFIGNEKFSFKNLIIEPKENPYDILLKEKGFNEDKEEQIFYSNDKSLFLPKELENKIKRVVGLKPIIRVYKDDEGRIKMDGYFD